MKNSVLFILILIFGLVGCKNQEKLQLPNAADVLHNNEKNLTDLIIYDIFSPPVASRIYAYTSLAAHEAIRHEDPAEASLVLKLKDFPEMPEPDKNKKYNYTLAASKAFYMVAANLTFSKDTLLQY